MWPRKRKSAVRETAYGSPWVDREEAMKRGLVIDQFGVPALPGFVPAEDPCSCGLPHGVFDVEKEGLWEPSEKASGCASFAGAMYEPAVGTDRVYAIEIIDGSGSQIIYTDDNPIISVREV